MKRRTVRVIAGVERLRSAKGLDFSEDTGREPQADKDGLLPDGPNDLVDIDVWKQRRQPGDRSGRYANTHVSQTPQAAVRDADRPEAAEHVVDLATG